MEIFLPDAHAALAYDATRVLADAIARANSTDGAKLRAALAETRNFAGVTGIISIDADRRCSKARYGLEAAGRQRHLSGNYPTRHARARALTQYLDKSLKETALSAATCKRPTRKTSRPARGVTLNISTSGSLPTLNVSTTRSLLTLDVRTASGSDRSLPNTQCQHEELVA